MDQDTPGKRVCPACSSGDYTFRSRKKVAAKPGEDGMDEVETKYRCKKCEHEWKVRVPASG